MINNQYINIIWQDDYVIWFYKLNFHFDASEGKSIVVSLRSHGMTQDRRLVKSLISADPENLSEKYERLHFPTDQLQNLNTKILPNLISVFLIEYLS